jgi:hypothetical protein
MLPQAPFLTSRGTISFSRGTLLRRVTLLRLGHNGSILREKWLADLNRNFTACLVFNVLACPHLWVAGVLVFVQYSGRALPLGLGSGEWPNWLHTARFSSYQLPLFILVQRVDACVQSSMSCVYQWLTYFYLSNSLQNSINLERNGEIST